MALSLCVVVDDEREMIVGAVGGMVLVDEEKHNARKKTIQERKETKYTRVEDVLGGKL